MQHLHANFALGKVQTSVSKCLIPKIRRDWWEKIEFQIIYELASMSSFRWHPPHLMDNADTLDLGDQHWQQTVLVFKDFFFIFVSICFSSCQWDFVCVQFILKFFKSYCNYLTMQYLCANFGLVLELKKAQTSVSKCLIPKVRGN